MPGQWITKTWLSDPTRNAPPRHRAACRYETFIPTPLAELSLEITADLAGRISETERELRRLNDEGGVALLPLARLLLRTESIASSKVEGLHVGARELARAEAKHAEGALPGPAAREIIANIDAMTIALEDASDAEEFSAWELLAIHRRLMERGLQPRLAGTLRTAQNWIGGNDYTPCGADFVPPPVEEVGRLLDDLFRAINDASLPPLMQAALVHAQFETIHPFDDGNGRTGRALVHTVLRRRGVAPRFTPPISVIFANNRQRYIQGLTDFRGEDVTAWLGSFVEATDRATRLARTYLEQVKQQKAEWRDALVATHQAPRRGATVWDLIDLLPGYPIITAGVAAARLERAPARVYDAIELLVRAGVLVPLSRGKRNRSWEATGMLTLIEEMESGNSRVREASRRGSR